MEYLYSKKNLLEESERYRYSSFQGMDFLESFFVERNRLISSLPEHDNKESDGVESIHDNNDSYDTLQYFKHFLHNYKDAKIIKDDGIALLLKKFEISKKIYSKISHNLNALKNSDYKNINLYIYFSACCCKAYEKTKHLSFLNALIKCNDIICSQKDLLFSNNFKITLLKHVFLYEKKTIQQMIKEKVKKCQ